MLFYIVQSISITLSRGTECHVFFNLNTELDCKPDIIAFNEEKFLRTLNS